MPTTAINFGRILILIGIAGYVYGLTTSYASMTALIPAAFGIVLLVLGHFAKAKESLRKHLMHAAVMVGLIGFLASLGGLIARFNKAALPAKLSQIAMALACLVFVFLCVRSFVEARKNRE